MKSLLCWKENTPKAFFNWATFFFYMYCRLCFDHFYSNVYITTALCVSKNNVWGISFCSTHMLQGLATHMAAFVSFQLLPHLRVQFCLLSLLFYHHRLFGHSLQLLVACHGFLFTHFCFSHHPLQFIVVYLAFLSLLSAI